MQLHPVFDPLSYLAGRWAIVRRIQDRRSGLCGVFTGTAQVQPEAFGRSYREEGEMRLGAHRGQAFREYRFLQCLDGRAAITHPDGSPFIDLDLTRGRWATEHWCAPDRYRVVYAVLGADCFLVRWRVTGPAKTYVLTSRYDRTG